MMYVLVGTARERAFAHPTDLAPAAPDQDQPDHSQGRAVIGPLNLADHEAGLRPGDDAGALADPEQADQQREDSGDPHSQTSSKSSRANSALSEMNANRDSALLPISRSTESAVPSRSSAKSTTRSSVRLAGSMVVSLSCAGIISPSPLKRPTSTLALALNSLFRS